MSNSPRFYLWLALAMLLWWNYTTWTTEFATAPAAGHTASERLAQRAPSSLANRVPSESAPTPAQTTPTTPTTPPGQPPRLAPPAPPAASIPSAPAAPSAAATLIRVRTDVYDIEISARGGTLEKVALLKYARVKGKAPRVVLENDASAERAYLLETGLTGPAGEPHPTHTALYRAAQRSYRLDGSGTLRVPLTWSSGGITVTKTFIFHKGSYRIELEYTVENHSAAPWQAAAYAQIFRYDPRTKTSYFNPASYAYHGPAIWNGEKYVQLDPASSDYKHFEQRVTSGWIATPQHDFVSVFVPPRGSPYRFSSEVSGPEYLLSALGPEHTVAPGATVTLRQTLFAGPQLHAQLEKIDPNLKYIVGYGWFTVLAGPLFWLLSKVHGVTGNWGVAIIVVTVLLKLLFYPLSEASGRSMAKMKALGPRIKNLQETYKDDKEKLGRAMMEIYKREKVNPVAGCLPMVIQIPFFFAFYRILLDSAEMRQAPFILWIHDLSARDPYFILPAIMAVASFVQYKLNPAPPDPVQAKMMMIMPIGMSVMFAFFPAGLVLYWVTNTLLSIAQQWNINRRIAAATARKT